MKKRIFSSMDNSVFWISIDTEDWSEGDLELMVQFGEPEVNVGGEISYAYHDEPKAKTFGDEFVRLLHGFPYRRCFDARDYEGTDEAVAIGAAWKEAVLARIDSAIVSLRSNVAPLPTEEVAEI